MESFEKTFKLPSNGYFGGPKEITLRAMTTKEEKLLYTSRDLGFLDRLIKSCCIEPTDLDTTTLHQNDIMYLTFALRELTFGNTYMQEVVCPHCGRERRKRSCKAGKAGEEGRTHRSVYLQFYLCIVSRRHYGQPLTGEKLSKRQRLSFQLR